MISIVAAVRRAGTDRVGRRVVARGTRPPRRFLLRWRGEADPRHVQAIDSYWVCRAEHGANASTFTGRVRRLDRRRLRGRDVRGRRRALRAAARRAPDRVLKMLDEVGRGDVDAVRARLSTAASASWASATASTAPRIPRPRSCGDARELESPRVEVAEALEQAALEELAARHPERVLATNVEFWSAVVLDIADIPPPLFPAMFACARSPAGRRTSSSRCAPAGSSGRRRSTSGPAPARIASR
jgi:citrate synthase